MADLEIRKVLCLSTHHVSEETSVWLDNEFDPIHQDLCGATVMGGPYDVSGWFIHIGSVFPGREIPVDLQKVFDFAKEHGCHHVLFDRDADIVDGLEVFEW